MCKATEHNIKASISKLELDTMAETLISGIEFHKDYETLSKQLRETAGKLDIIDRRRKEIERKWHV